MPLTVVTHSYRHIENAPFLLFTQYPIYDLHVNPEAGRVTFQVRGDSRLGCAMRLIPTDRRSKPEITVHLEAPGAQMHRTGLPTKEGHMEYFIVGGSLVSVEWQKTRERRLSAAAAGRATNE